MRSFFVLLLFALCAVAGPPVSVEVNGPLLDEPVVECPDVAELFAPAPALGGPIAVARNARLDVTTLRLDVAPPCAPIQRWYLAPEVRTRESRSRAV